MSIELLEKMRRLNKILQTAGADSVSFQELSNELSSLSEANVYVISRKGKILSYTLLGGAKCDFMSEEVFPENKFPESFNRFAMGITESKANIVNLENKCIVNEAVECVNGYKYSTIIPIYGAGDRIGTLMMGKFEEEFSIEDLLIAEYGATVVSIEIIKAKSDRIEIETRNKAVVQMAIGTLSYSELEAVEHIFAELDGTEGLLVASKIADKAGITRSVIVNALRKLESAGVIESRSLGMKGTHIKILNDKLMDELEKLR